MQMLHQTNSSNTRVKNGAPAKITDLTGERDASGSTRLLLGGVMDKKASTKVLGSKSITGISLTGVYNES